MATVNYTTLLGLALPTTGDLSGQWGNEVNEYISKYVDASVAGTQTISGSQTAVTLSPTNGSALSQAGSGATGSSQYAVINCTGNPASTLTITVTYSSLTNAQFSKTYAVINATSTSQSVVVRATTSSGTSSGVTVASGERCLITWNGSNFVKVSSTVITNLTGTLPTTNGGTGLTSFTANGVVYASSSSALTTGSALVFDGNNLGLGVTPSAWGGGGKPLQAVNASFWGLVGTPTFSSVGANYFYDGAYKYISNGVASDYFQLNGAHGWRTAASGTAGNAISFTTAMTLDASGNLGLGTTSPNIYGTSNSTNVFGVQGSGANDNGLIAVSGRGTGAGGIEFGNATIRRAGVYALDGSVLVFYTNGSNSGFTLSERARITSGGQFAVSSAGTAGAPVISKSDDLDTGIFFPAANELAFAVNGVEELRITSAGFTRPVAYADTVSALGNTGTATTINLQNANVFTATLTGNCTFTLSNAIATGSSSFTLILTNDGTAGRTVAWSGGAFRFPGGAASLSRTTTANAVDIWVFFTPDGGTTWYGNIAMKNMAA